MRINELRIKLIEYGLVLFVFLLPWQTRYIFREGRLNGGPWEYGTISIYVTESLLWIIFLFAVVSVVKNLKNSKHEARNPKQFQNSNVQNSKRFWSFGFRISNLFRVLDLGFLILLAFLIFSFISILWAPDRALALRSALTLAEGVGLFFILRFFPLKPMKIVWGFVAGVTLQAILGISQFLTQTTFSSKWFGMALHLPGALGTSVVETAGERWLRAYGSLPHPNVLAGYIVAALLLLFFFKITRQQKNKKTNVILLSCYIVLVTALFFTFSRAAWLALLLGIGIYVLANITRQQYNKITIAILLFCYFVVLSMIFWQPFSSRIFGEGRLEVKATIERISSIEEAFGLIADNPLVGVGIGNYTVALHKKSPTLSSWDYQPVHNIYLLILAELGIIGFLLFLVFLFSLFFRQPITQLPNYQLLIAVLFLGLFDHFLWSLYPGVLLFWFSLGLTSLIIRSKTAG